MSGMSTTRPTILSLNVSPGGIPKIPVSPVELTPSGLAGDGHNHDKHCTPQQAVSILDAEDLLDLSAEGFDVYPGAMGENITVQDLDVDELEIGDRLFFSGGVSVELTKRRSPCYVLDAIDPELKHASRGRIGWYGKVLEPGHVHDGEEISVVHP